MALTNYIRKSMGDIGPETFRTMPKLRFAEDTNLKMLADRIEQQVLLTEIPRYEANDITLSYSKLINDAIEHLDDAPEILNETVAALSHLVTGTFDLLKDSITPEVTSLVQDIVGRAHQYLGVTSDNMTVDDLGIYNNRIVCRIIDLCSYCDKLQGIDIITKVLHEHAGISEPQPAGKFLSFIASKLPERVDLYQLAGTSEQQVVDEYLAAVRDVISKESELIGGQSLITDEDITKAFSHIRGVYSNGDKYYTSSFVEYAFNYLDAVFPYIDYFKSALGDISPKNAAILEKCIVRAQWYINFFAYALHCVRHQTPLGNSLILSETLINKSIMDVFQLDGGTIDDIQDFIRTYYNPDKEDIMSKYYGTNVRQTIPETGLTLEFVTSRKSEIQTHMTTAKLAFAQQYQTLRKNAILLHITPVLSEYVEKFVEPIAPFQTIQDMQAFAKNVLIPECVMKVKTDTEAAFEPHIYNFIFRLRYPKHIVKTVYEKLGNEYIKMIRNTENPSDGNILFADMTVMADIICDFIIGDSCVIAG